MANDPEAGAYGKEDKLEDYSPAVKDAGHPDWEDKLPITASRTAKWCAPRRRAPSQAPTTLL